MRACFATLGIIIGTALAQPMWVVMAQSRSPFAGMWSDAPATPEGDACQTACTDVGVSRLNALLDDPKNDSRPFAALAAEARKFETDTYIVPRLTDAARKTYPLNPQDDPGFLKCEPWGVARQIFAQHQLQIRQAAADTIEMRYGEWDAKRVVYLDERKAPSSAQPTPMGRSLGRFEGNTLVIETTRISPNWTRYLTRHSEQLRIVERYNVSNDGKLLTLTATLQDPVSLREPLVFKKMWTWAPKAVIAPYTNCELPTGLLEKRN